MPHYDELPRCPYCQAVITGGDHCCQKSPQDDFYRRMQTDMGPNSGETIREMRSFDEQMKEDAREFGYPYAPRWRK